MPISRVRSVSEMNITFAMPMAVFPALAQHFGGAHAVGYLYSAMSVGAFLTTVFSAWTKRVERHGAAVILAAMLWGLAIFALGFAQSLPVAVACLVAAGAADMVSALFRMTIWNETIPSTIRGRMAGIELPVTVDLTVTDTAPGIKGATASAQVKLARNGGCAPRA